ncbi:MAG: hypothetical protein A2341_18270 [Deltaproteobacteria bacterium RIFOXYB12_FULL_58_9]|nr:MAG: hypothetical protein A2341_18270 [Deltaproteobacteria bacterium RIFOXYB12_FULL_58_9]
MIGFRNAKNLADAIAALTDLPHWRPVCGGTDLLVQVSMGRSHAAGFVDIWGSLPRHIEARGKVIHIGAGTTCSDVAHSPLIRELLPPLWEAARTMGSPLIRNRATLGGNIGNASPAADMVAAMVVEETRAIVRGASGDRTVPLTKLMLGPGKTKLAPGELVVELMVPKPSSSTYCRFDKLGFRKAQVIAAVNFAIRVTGKNGGIDDIRISWGSVAPTAVRSHTIEDMLRGVALTEHSIDEAVAAVSNDISPIDDHRGSAAYRLAVARSFLRRALEECATWLSS